MLWIVRVTSYFLLSLTLLKLYTVVASPVALYSPC